MLCTGKIMPVVTMQDAIREYNNLECEIEWHGLNSAEAYLMMERHKNSIELLPTFHRVYQGDFPKFVVDFVACKKLNIIRPGATSGRPAISN